MLTEGNDLQNQTPSVVRFDTENDSNNVMKNNHLDSEFEPVGSQ